MRVPIREGERREIPGGAQTYTLAPAGTSRTGYVRRGPWGTTRGCRFVARRSGARPEDQDGGDESRRAAAVRVPARGWWERAAAGSRGAGPMPRRPAGTALPCPRLANGRLCEERGTGQPNADEVGPCALTPPATARRPPRRRCALRLALPDSRRVGMREDDVEGRPPSQLAIGPDPPATLLDDLAGDRQAKARSRDAAADARLDPAAPIRPARSERPRSDGGLGARRSITPSTPRARFTTGRGGRGI